MSSKFGIPIIINASGNGVKRVPIKNANQNTSVVFVAKKNEEVSLTVNIPGKDTFHEAKYAWYVSTYNESSNKIELYSVSHEESYTLTFLHDGVYIVRVTVSDTDRAASIATATLALAGEETTSSSSVVIIVLLILGVLVLIIAAIIPFGIWLFKRRERRGENHFATASNLAGTYAMPPSGFDSPSTPALNNLYHS